MGNSNGGRRRLRAGAAADTTESSILGIEQQREKLAERKRRHGVQINELMKCARNARAANDRQGAIDCMRRVQVLKAHSGTIQGMHDTLTQHYHSLEAKMMTAETMAVMRTSAQALSANTMSVGAVDEMMVRAEEATTDIGHIAHAMGTTDALPTDDDALLAMLDDCDVAAAPVGPDAAQAVVATQAAAAAPLLVDDDARFLALLEAGPKLPPAPGHVPGRGVLPPPAYSEPRATGGLAQALRM